METIETNEVIKGTTPTPTEKETGNGNGNGKHVRKRCKAINANGQPCAGWVLSDSDYCWSHDPSNVEERHAARVLGGVSNRAKHSPRVNLGQIPKEIRTIEELLQLLDYCKDEMLFLSNSLSRNKALVQLASTYSQVIKDAGLEDRLGKMQAQVLGLLEKAKATRKR